MQKLINTSALFCFVFLCVPTLVRAQDKQFTQFYASPLTLNPALTGAFEGRYRVAAIYRDQWRSVLDEPVVSYAVAGDFRFSTKGKRVKKDAFGLGLAFVNDRVSVLDFNTTQIALSLAYHKSLGVNNNQFLSAGVQGGLTQRTLNYAALNFQDEFNGSTGFDLPTGEEFPENSFGFGDLNVGINYTAKFGNNSNFFAGLAAHHANRPQVAFYNTTNAGDRLYTRYSAQLAASLHIGPRQSHVTFLPRLIIASQGPHLLINAGGNFRTALGPSGTTALHFGTWARPVRNADGMGLDAMVALVGLEFNSVLIGMSYDLNLGALSARQRKGAFEISIAYLGSFESEGILCPKF